MAKIPLQKVRITGIKKHYRLLMQELQKYGFVHIVKEEELKAASPFERLPDHTEVFDIARLEDFVSYMSQFEEKESAGMFADDRMQLTEKEVRERAHGFMNQAPKLIEELGEMREYFVRAKNDTVRINERIEKIAPYADANFTVQSEYMTEYVQVLFGKIPTQGLDVALKQAAEISPLIDIEVLAQTASASYIMVSSHNDDAKKAQSIIQENGFEELKLWPEFSEFEGSTIQEVITALESRRDALVAGVEKREERRGKLLAHLDEARILLEFTQWNHEKEAVQESIYTSDMAFAFEAWMPVSKIDWFKGWVKNIFVGEVGVELIKKHEKETVPVLLHNSWGAESFEPMTEMYGMPGDEDLDPTPYMAPFFVAFFGICLSDVGYGLMLLLTSTYLLLKSKATPQAKKMIWFIWFCGFSATFAGVLLGGYFGMTPDQAPAFLVNEAGDAFKGQLLNATEGNGPLTFLIFSFIVGYIHLLFGLVVDFIRRMKIGDRVGAFADSAAWFYFLIGLGLVGGGTNLGVDPEVSKNVAISGAVLLILTQGRAQKNWLLKPIAGLLGLYGVMNYISDILSYSRLMALGLATGVIGFSMNKTAAVLFEMISVPGVNYAVAIIVLLFGHGLNFGLSFLGASIHSMRLQFIEFFGRFYTGGGSTFEPFKRAYRFLTVRS